MEEAFDALEETVIEDPVLADLLRELVREDRALIEADLARRRAIARFEVATSRFVALRDIATRRLGYNPYDRRVGRFRLADPDSIEHLFDDAPNPLQFASGGRFRYLGMSPGEAATNALRASSRPLSLDELIGELRQGGINAQPRSINAALMNTPRLVKSDDGLYSIERDGDDADS